MEGRLLCLHLLISFLSNMYLMRLPKFNVFQAAMMVLKTTWIRNFIGIFESSFKTELFFWNGRNLIIPSNVGMLANDQRTTNLLEGPGGTDGFRVVDVSHPDVYKLLISLIREASQNRNNHRCPNSMWWTKNRPRKKRKFQKTKIYTIVSTVGEWGYKKTCTCCNSFAILIQNILSLGLGIMNKSFPFKS